MKRLILWMLAMSLLLVACTPALQWKSVSYADVIFADVLVDAMVSDRQPEMSSTFFFTRYDYQDGYFVVAMSQMGLDTNDPPKNNTAFVNEETEGVEYEDENGAYTKMHLWGIDVIYVRDVENEKIVEQYLFFQYPNQRYGVQVQFEDTEEGRKLRDEFLDSVEIRGIE